MYKNDYTVFLKKVDLLKKKLKTGNCRVLSYSLNDQSALRKLGNGFWFC